MQLLELTSGASGQIAVMSETFPDVVPVSLLMVQYDAAEALTPKAEPARTNDEAAAVIFISNPLRKCFFIIGYIPSIKLTRIVTLLL